MSVKTCGAGTRMARAAVLAVIVLCHGKSDAAAADLETLRAEWLGAHTPEQYSAAVAALIDYRAQARFAKTPEIDYMIATGLCRIPGREADGARLFAWIFDHYSLAPDEQVISQERDKCGRQTAKATVTFAMMAGQGGSAGVHGKLFYWLGRSDAAAVSDPIEVVDPPSAKDLRARLFDLDAVQAAESAARHRLDASFTVAGANGFVVAGAGGYTPEALQDIAERLGKFGSFYVGAFGLSAPKKIVTVYLVPDPYQMVGLALKLHGLRIPDSMIGYSYPGDISMVGVVQGKAVGTLGHELLRLMVRDQAGDLPPWLEEGIAALYESTNIAQKYLPGGPSGAVPGEVPVVGGELAVRGLPNWRGCVLQKLWVEGFDGIQVQRPSLAELAGMNWNAFYGMRPEDMSDDRRVARAAVSQATARYLMLYLQDQDHKLFDLFHSFATRDPFKITTPLDEDARQRLAEQLGPLDAADEAFDRWLRPIIATQDCRPQ